MANGFRSSDCLVALTAIEADVKQLIEGLTEAQFHAPSRSGGWSVGFCLEHLILSGQAFFPKWDRALRDVQTRKPPSNHHDLYSLWQRAVLCRLEPPYRIKSKATQLLVPSTRRSIEDTLNRFSKLHVEMVRRIELGGMSVPTLSRVQSPFAPWVWYPLGFSFDLALAHERRHIWQAWQVRRQYETRK